jgi:hypothetical protein
VFEWSHPRESNSRPAAYKWRRLAGSGQVRRIWADFTLSHQSRLVQIVVHVLYTESRVVNCYLGCGGLLFRVVDVVLKTATDRKKRPYLRQAYVRRETSGATMREV